MQMADKGEKLDPAYTDGPFYVVDMPINAHGHGPEMDPAKVQVTLHEVWNGHCLSLGQYQSRPLAQWVTDALNAASRPSTSTGESDWVPFTADEIRNELYRREEASRDARVPVTVPPQFHSYSSHDLRAMLASAPAPDTKQEPVAWTNRANLNVLKQQEPLYFAAMHHENTAEWNVPLYASPVTQKVSEADYDRGRRDVLNAILAPNPAVAQKHHVIYGGTEATFKNHQGQLPFDVVFWVCEVAEQLGIEPRDEAPAPPLQASGEE